MLAQTKPVTVSAGYPIVFNPGELEVIHHRKQTSMRDVRKLIGRKAMGIILPMYHNVKPERFQETLGKVRIIRVVLREDTPKHWGQLIEILYRFVGVAGTYRHVFHFVSSNGGLSGQLFTQTRRFIAK